MSGGGAAGGSAGGLAAPAVAAFPNSKFIGLAQVAIVGAPQGVAVVTVREQQGTQASILEGWSFNGASTPVQSRSISWATDYRVQGIGSNQVVTYVAGRSSLSITAEEISSADLSRVGVATSLTALTAGSDAGVTRMNLLSSNLAPVVVWVGDGVSSTVHRMETQNASSVAALVSTPAQSFTQGDDIIEAPTGALPNRWLATSRCTGDCSLLTSTSFGTGTVGRLAWGPYSTTVAALNPPTLFTTITSGLGGAAVFDSGSPIRVATDGNTFIYLAGQGPFGTLVVERRDAVSGARDMLYSSSAALRLVDITRAQNGVGVYLLVALTQAVTFAGTSFNPVSANQGNVAVIRIDAMTGVSANFFDIPLDQQPVAFARSQGFLYIAVQEGTNAVLWKIPAP